MNIVLKIIALVIIVGGISIPTYLNSVDKHNNKKQQKKFSCVSVIAGLIIFILSSSFVIIPTGFSGVRTTFGQISSQSVHNGFNWKIPFVQSIQKVNNKQQDITFADRVWSETKQRTAIYYENIVVTYQINPEKSAWIYANVSNYDKSLVSYNIVSSALKSSSKSLSDTDATNRSIIEPLCMKNLQKSLDEKYGKEVVIINKVIINNADFEDSYNEAIAAKQKAQLEAEKQAIDNEKAVKKAESDAQVQRTSAQAEADARLVKAEAEAKANELLEKSLTEQILQEAWINKWDGKVPEYVAGDSGSVLFGIGAARGE